MEDIHGIRPPVMVGMDPAHIKLTLALTAGLLALVILVMVIRYFWKKRKNIKNIEALPIICPYEKALGQLDRLTTGPVHDAKAFYFSLGHVVKEYMGRTYGFNCLELTTQELNKTLRNINMTGQLVVRVSKFQDLCDPYRYAPLTPGADQVETDLSRARDLIMAMEEDKIAEPDKNTEPGTTGAINV